MSLVGKFASVGGATMVSRLLGFVREAMIAGALGAGPVTDAFYAAFRFPNLFRRVFAEGAFNTAFVPLFAKEVEGGGNEAAQKFAEEVLSVLFTVLFVFSALAMIFMPFLVSTVVAPGFVSSPEKFELTVLMTRIMFPYLACMSLMAMMAGILNTMRIFFLPAVVTTLLSVFQIIAIAGGMLLGIGDETMGTWQAWAVFFSGLVQFGVLAIAVRRQGLRLRLRLPRITPEVKRLLILMVPALVTGGVTQINLLVGQIIASLQENAISVLNFADRINQLPLGVIGVAVGVVLLPELSRSLKAGNFADAQHLQNRSLEFALVLTVPAAIGMVVLPGPIVSLLYERGSFSAADTAMTAAALAAFATGLPAYVLQKVFQPGFFAREDMRTPMWFSMISVAANIALSLAMFPFLGHVAIALATSISAWVNVVLLAMTLWRRSHFRPSSVTVRRCTMILLSSAVMGVVAWWLGHALIEPAMGEGLVRKAASILGTIAISAVVYLVAVVLSGGIDKGEIKRSLRRRRA
ncbi:murein biosynthesis integral membrane protein MurJ [Chelativorans composti]|jgi:integral membrane protein MviN|uniref:Probable lipid II flippase MurJ n=1 Tax=Chelativorans composti TaxID=768533 RepID=A0ABW5DEQ4_9HYPH|nr:murein biosynthesis integral membrane protein MurJ [bacterium SGD-2]